MLFYMSGTLPQKSKRGGARSSAASFSTIAIQLVLRSELSLACARAQHESPNDEEHAESQQAQREEQWETTTAGPARRR